MIGEKSEQLLARIVALHHGVADVWAVETGDEDFGGVEAKTGNDLLPRQLVGRRGERDAREEGGPGHRPVFGGEERGWKIRMKSLRTPETMHG